MWFPSSQTNVFLSLLFFFLAVWCNTGEGAVQCEPSIMGDGLFPLGHGIDLERPWRPGEQQVAHWPELGDMEQW